jgi:hypothetical protein
MARSIREVSDVSSERAPVIRTVAVSLVVRDLVAVRLGTYSAPANRNLLVISLPRSSLNNVNVAERQHQVGKNLSSERTKKEALPMNAAIYSRGFRRFLGAGAGNTCCA